MAESEALKKQGALLVAARARDQEKGVRIREMEKMVKANAKEMAKVQELLAAATKFRESPIPVRFSGDWRKTKKKEGATAVVLLSDWHCEEVIPSSHVGGVNEYNWDIMLDRQEAVLDRSLLLTRDARGLASIDHSVVFLLGDFIHGAIHEDNLMSTSRTPIEATVGVGEILTKWLLKFWKHSKLERLDVCCQPGNHSRARQKKFHAAKNQQCLEFLMYKSLAAKFGEMADVNIHFHIPDCPLGFIDIRGYRIRFLHGDHPGISGSGAASFIPGACSTFTKWDQDETHNLWADHTVFGDRHQYSHPGDIASWTSNGCLCGFGTYCLSGFACRPIAPSQTFMVIDAKRCVTRALPIYCD